MGAFYSMEEESQSDIEIAGGVSSDEEPDPEPPRKKGRTDTFDLTEDDDLSLLLTVQV